MEIPQGTLDREIEITVWVARDEKTRRYYLEESFLGPPLDFNLRINARSARGGLSRRSRPLPTCTGSD